MGVERPGVTGLCQEFWIFASAVGLLFFFYTSALHAQDSRAEWKPLNDELATLYRVGKYDRAVVVAQKALEVAETNFGPEHSAVASSLHKLGLLYQTLGEYAKGEPLFLRSQAIAEKAFHPRHSAVATVSDRSRSFQKQNCRVTLPAGADWLNPTSIPTEVQAALVASYQFPEKATVFVLAEKIPDRVKDAAPPAFDLFIRSWEEHFLSGTAWKKVEGKRIRFRDLDAYDLQLLVEEAGRLGHIRVFLTADWQYQIQVAGTSRSAIASPMLDACFSSFDFLQAPKQVGWAPVAAGSTFGQWGVRAITNMLCAALALLLLFMSVRQKRMNWWITLALLLLWVLTRQMR